MLKSTKFMNNIMYIVNISNLILIPFKTPTHNIEIIFPWETT